MRALTYHGQGDVRVDTHPDPKIEKPTDAIIRITSTAICGSDLHLYDGYIAMMKAGDIIGHEPMGIVEEVGSEVKNIKKGDRVVVSFTISCGQCWFCEQTLYSMCDNSNPKPENAEAQMGHSPAAVYGYSHLLGGIPADRPNTFAYPTPTWVPSRSNPTWRMKRCSFSPISFPPATWPPRTPRSSPVTP